MLEYLAAHGYDADLVGDLYRILFTGWTENELRVLAVFLTIAFGSQVRRMF